VDYGTTPPPTAKPHLALVFSLICIHLNECDLATIRLVSKSWKESSREARDVAIAFLGKNSVQIAAFFHAYPLVSHLYLRQVGSWALQVNSVAPFLRKVTKLSLSHVIFPSWRVLQSASSSMDEVPDLDCASLLTTHSIATLMPQLRCLELCNVESPLDCLLLLLQGCTDLTDLSFTRCDGLTNPLLVNILDLFPLLRDLSATKCLGLAGYCSFPKELSCQLTLRNICLNRAPKLFSRSHTALMTAITTFTNTAATNNMQHNVGLNHVAADDAGRPWQSSPQQLLETLRAQVLTPLYFPPFIHTLNVSFTHISTDDLQQLCLQLCHLVQVSADACSSICGDFQLLLSPTSSKLQLLSLKATALRTVDITSWSLQSLSIQLCTKLESISLSTPKLQSLDVSMSQSLTILSFAQCLSMKQLTVCGCGRLLMVECSDAELSSKDPNVYRIISTWCAQCPAIDWVHWIRSEVAGTPLFRVRDKLESRLLTNLCK
jgi:hypothetical protein